MPSLLCHGTSKYFVRDHVSIYGGYCRSIEEEDEPPPLVFQDWQDRDPILHDLDNDLIDGFEIINELYPQKKTIVRDQPDVSAPHMIPVRPTDSWPTNAIQNPKNRPTKIASSAKKSQKITRVPIHQGTSNNKVHPNPNPPYLNLKYR